MNYKFFKELFDDDNLTPGKISQAIVSETGTVLCINDEGYYLDNLDDFFGEDDTIDVPTDIAIQITSHPAIVSKLHRGIRIFQIKY